MNTSEIENMLRHAPSPKPPSGLGERLKSQVPGREVQRACRPVTARAAGGWFARWWPALAPAAISLACVAVLAVQHSEIKSLQQAIQAQVQAQQSALALGSAQDSGLRANSLAGATQDQTAVEIARLKSLVNELAAEVAALEKLRAENERLRAQLAAGAGDAFTPEEAAALEGARNEALEVQCVNNLKQLGLAAKVWALDNQDTTPPGIAEMANEISTPKILVCPADTGRQAASDWASYTPANCSYEYLAPSAPDTEPQRILYRCPSHGNVCLMDGSVQRAVGKKHPEWIVQREGKLYFQYTQPQNDPATAAGGDTSSSQ